MLAIQNLFLRRLHQLPTRFILDAIEHTNHTNPLFNILSEELSARDKIGDPEHFATVIQYYAAEVSP